MKLSNLSRYFLMIVLFAGVALSGCDDDDDNGNDNTTGGAPPTEVIGTSDGNPFVQVNPDPEGITGGGSSTFRMTADTTYLLNGFVFVNPGDTLIIEAGTIIRGKEVPENTDDNASALIVSRGATIIAEGTPSNPIIFTAEADNLGDPGDDVALGRGLWGGVILLGDAAINVSGGTNPIEGITDTEPRGQFGGGSAPNNGHDIGTFAYVSIRHGGAEIGAGNEINGLTMGGLGQGSDPNEADIHHVEVIWNLDDGFEFFGGVPRTSHLAAVFCGDDNFDYDEGFSGKGQFWFGLFENSAGGRAGEHDGGTDPEDGTPFATPEIFNATYLGRGPNESGNIITFRDNAGGMYFNSIFAGFENGIEIEDLASGEDSWSRFLASPKDLVVRNCLFYEVANDTLFQVTEQNTVDSDSLTQVMTSSFNNTDVQSSPVISFTAGSVNSLLGNVDPTPAADALMGADDEPGGFFQDVNYRGAFSSNAAGNWLKGGWSFTGDEVLTP